ncbi:MAG: hypothetical protein P9L90_05730 [Candidatus Aadella gelida]|nr:hypothetical protein [Candidatus Aadella gelida]
MKKKEPKNYAYWKSVIEDPDKAAEFMIRGSDRQKKEIKKVFKYIENQKTLDQPDLFNQGRN